MSYAIYQICPGSTDKIIGFINSKEDFCNEINKLLDGIYDKIEFIDNGTNIDNMQNFLSNMTQSQSIGNYLVKGDDQMYLIKKDNSISEGYFWNSQILTAKVSCAWKLIPINNIQ